VAATVDLISLAGHTGIPPFWALLQKLDFVVGNVIGVFETQRKLDAASTVELLAEENNRMKGTVT
jgi:hypothetical protein